MLLTWHWTDPFCLWFLLGSFSLEQKAEGISLHRTVPKMLFQSVVLLQSCQSRKQKSKETLFKTSDPTACLASCFLRCSPAFIGIWEIVGVFLPFSIFSVKPRTDPKLSHCVPTPQLAFAWLLIFSLWQNTQSWEGRGDVDGWKFQFWKRAAYIWTSPEVHWLRVCWPKAPSRNRKKWLPRHGQLQLLPWAEGLIIVLS